VARHRGIAQLRGDFFREGRGGSGGGVERRAGGEQEEAGGHGLVAHGEAFG
jgi:hypothetical protein